MAYYFMIENRKKNEKSNFEAIDISKSPAFLRFSNFNGNKYSLEDIDAFTIHFENEKELITHLFKGGIISMQDTRKPMSIRQKKHNEYRKVPYGFLYQKDIEYFMEPKKLISKIMDKLYTGDYEFLQALGDRYENSKICGVTASEVKLYATDAKVNQYSEKYLYAEDENRDTLVARLVKLIIYDHYAGNKIVYKKDKDGKYIVKSKGLHDLILFVNNYESKEKTNEKVSSKSEETTPSELTYYESLFEIDSKTEETDEHEESKCKKRVLTKDNQIEGQYNLFDLMN